MKLVVDGVFFQLASSGIARIWSSILPRLASQADLELVLLDRGGCPSIDGARSITFPSYSMHSNTAADSFLIEKFCKELGADAFTSTYYTTPVSIPSVLMIYDMIPEVLGFDLSQRAWQEKQIAISFASYYVCISETTRSDLTRFYPSTQDRSTVANCGVQRGTFGPRDETKVMDFKRRFGIAKPYFLLVGSREQHLGYKNGTLLFSAVRKVRDADIEIICIGGEPEISPASLARLPPNVTARRIDLKDDDLACAYAGAEALVYPSLYEGFGMPVIEAMACGCPVICTGLGALAEISGDAAIRVSGRAEDELWRAMDLVREPTVRKRLVESGLVRAALYDWEPMSRELHHLLSKASAGRETSQMKEFFHQWKRFRTIQAEVDPGI